MRTTVRGRRDLVIHRGGVANQLRAHLQIVFPAATGLSTRSTPKPACGSWNGSALNIRRTGSPRNDSADGLASISYSGGTPRAYVTVLRT